jgi:hypothetical protein
MKIFTHRFLKLIKAIKFLFNELVDLQTNNYMIRGKGKTIGYVGRDGFFTQLKDKSSTIDGETPDS